LARGGSGPRTSKKEVSKAKGPKRKRTKKEALARLDRIDVIPNIPSGLLPPPLRVPFLVGNVIEELGRAGAKGLVSLDPLDRLQPAQVQEIINNPSIMMDGNGGLVSSEASGTRIAAAKPRTVTKKMKMQRKIQSTAFRNANAKGRKKNGEFRAGFDQSRIARMAQKECTKERQRLGLCDKPMKMKKK